MKINYTKLLSSIFRSNIHDRTIKKLTDVSKLHGLGWKHSIELKEGILRMYDWYREKYMQINLILNIQYQN